MLWAIDAPPSMTRGPGRHAFNLKVPDAHAHGSATGNPNASKTTKTTESSRTLWSVWVQERRQQDSNL